MEVDLSSGLIKAGGREVKAKPIPPFMLELIREGGLINLLRKRLEESNMKLFNVAVVGATGASGTKSSRRPRTTEIPGKKPETSCVREKLGLTIRYMGHDVEVEILKEDSFKGVDIGLFSPGDP